jgi:hypothetical protein
MFVRPWKSPKGQPRYVAGSRATDNRLTQAWPQAVVCVGLEKSDNWPDYHKE